MMDRKENSYNKSFKYFWTKKLLQNPKYAEQTKKIKEGFDASFLKALIVTSSLSYPSPDFVVKVLSITDKEVDIRHSWRRSEDSNKVAWSGSFVLYRKWKDLEEAANYIVRNLENVRVLWFQDLVHLLIIAERSHKLYGVGYSKIIIKGRRSFEREEFLNFRIELAKFGDVKKIKFFKGKTEFGKVAEVDYRFTTHAFVAKFHLNGMVYEDLGYLHAEVKETEKEKSIRKEVIRRFVQHFDLLAQPEVLILRQNLCG